MIDLKKCMAPRDDAPIGGARCQAAATHETLMGRRCALHAEALRINLRNPKTLGNVLAGGRARTEEEIAVLVRELPSKQAKGESP